MNKLTKEDIHALSLAVGNIATVKFDIEVRGNPPTEKIKERMATCIATIATILKICPQCPEDAIGAAYHAINAATAATSRRITVLDLPKVRTEKRNGYPDWYGPQPKTPKRISLKTRAIRIDNFFKNQRGHSAGSDGDDTVTHIASGTVWGAASCVTRPEILAVISQ